MNREIKFRVWYKNQMLYPPDKFDSALTCRTSNGFQTEIFPRFSLDGRWYINGEFQKYELMQFTGLIDKNGKEIYEGDILRFPNTLKHILPDPYDPYSLEVVNFDAEQVCWVCGGYYLHEIVEEADVIGNIYENPELLNN